ncbi:MAG: hypothetical protein AB7S26_36925 [Sandaracinaceae bacterium]
MDDLDTQRWFDPILKPVGRSLKASLAAAGVAGALSLAAPSEAAAQQDLQPYGAGGVYIGYQWGGGGMHGVQWGVEGRGGFNMPAPGFSAMAVGRFGFVNLDPELHFGGQAGTTFGLIATMGELTFGYRWGEREGFSMPIGFELDVYFATTYLRFDPLLMTGEVGGGAYVLPRDGLFGVAVDGRPLHDEAGRAPLPTLSELDERAFAHDLDRETALRVANAYGQRAKGEWASVPAFIQLAEQLRVVGAPASLSRRALRAADDEVRHAIGTARASAACTGAPLRLGAVTPDTRAPAEGSHALVRLAVESWVDGCLGEGHAAAVAMHEHEYASHASLRALKETVATDEARHAELAWDVLAWTIEQGGDDVRHAIDAVRAASPSASAAEGEGLRGFGLLGDAERSRVGEQVRERANRRLDEVIRG